VLWPGRAPSAAANNLHQALHVARAHLDDGAGGRRCLHLDEDVLSLHSVPPVWDGYVRIVGKGGPSRSPPREPA
jgi:hypothetical protein